MDADPRQLWAIGNPEEWTTRSACRDADPGLFEPRGDDERRARPYPPRAEYAARRYCQGCPVREECRAKADRYREQGVWAGDWRIGNYQTYRLIPIELVSQRTPAA